MMGYQLNPTKHKHQEERKCWGRAAWFLTEKMEEGYNTNLLVYFASCALSLSYLHPWDKSFKKKPLSVPAHSDVC